MSVEHKESVMGYAHIDGEVEFDPNSNKCPKCKSSNVAVAGTGAVMNRHCYSCGYQWLVAPGSAREIAQEQLRPKHGPDGGFGFLGQQSTMPPVVKDRTKARFDLIPWGPMWEVAEVFTDGMKVPGRVAHNWRKGTEWSDYFAATHRHLAAYQQGSDRDDKSGLHHLAHAAACVLILLEYQLAELGTDDRYPVTKYEGKKT